MECRWFCVLRSVHLHGDHIEPIPTVPFNSWYRCVGFFITCRRFCVALVLHVTSYLTTMFCYCFCLRETLRNSVFSNFQLQTNNPFGHDDRAADVLFLPSTASFQLLKGTFRHSSNGVMNWSKKYWNHRTCENGVRTDNQYANVSTSLLLYYLTFHFAAFSLGWANARLKGYSFVCLKGDVNC